MLEVEVKNLEEFEAEATRFAKALASTGEGATLVTLSGELGAGKTAFVKAVARTLGVTDAVQSPTFVLEKKYQLSNSSFKQLVHIDAYRLEGGKDLVPLHFTELLEDGGALVFLEWPEKVSDALPTPAYSVSITSQPDGSRTISYDPSL